MRFPKRNRTPTYQKPMKNQAQPFLLGSTVYLLQQGIPMVDDKGRKCYGRVRISTGLTLPPDQWDDDRKGPSLKYSTGDQFTLQRKLDEQAVKLNIAYERAKAEKNLTPQRIRELFEDMGAKPSRAAIVNRDPDAITLVEVLEGIETKTEALLTRRQYASFRSKVEAYDKGVRMSKITTTWRDNFFAWVEKEHGLSESSMWNTQKFLNKAIAVSADLGVKLQVKTSHDYKLESAVTDWLDWSDLNKLVRHRPSTDRLQDAKTLLLTTCLTSIRISDYTAFFSTLAIRNGVYCASFKTKKKPNPLVMPVVLKPLADQIKAHGIPKKRSEQGIRKAMQDLVDEMGIKKKITPHTGRRAFITNHLSSCPQIPARVLTSVFTGHAIGASSELRVFLGYNQGTIAADQALYVKLIKTIDPKDVGGIKLL